MRQSVQLFRIWGIPVGFSTSWFLIFALIAWTLADSFLPNSLPGLSNLQYWYLGAATSVFFFGSVVLTMGSQFDGLQGLYRNLMRE